MSTLMAFIDLMCSALKSVDDEFMSQFSIHSCSRPFTAPPHRLSSNSRRLHHEVLLSWSTSDKVFVKDSSHPSSLLSGP